MKLKLADLQESDEEAQKLRATKELQECLSDINRVLRLSFVPKIMQTELISQHHNNSLVRHFGIDKIRKLISRKYCWLSPRKDGWAYVKCCNVCLTLKTVRYKLYNNLQALPVSIHRWKDLSIDFVTGLPVSTDWKGENYNSILVIVDRFTKMLHYEPVKVTIDNPRLAKVKFNMVIQHNGLLNLIVFDKDLLYISKFWHCSATSLALNRGSPRLFILKLMAKQNGRIAL